MSTTNSSVNDDLENLLKDVGHVPRGMARNGNSSYAGGRRGGAPRWDRLVELLVACAMLGVMAWAYEKEVIRNVKATVDWVARGILQSIDATEHNSTTVSSQNAQPNSELHRVPETPATRANTGDHLPDGVSSNGTRPDAQISSEPVQVAITSPRNASQVVPKHAVRHVRPDQNDDDPRRTYHSESVRFDLDGQDITTTRGGDNLFRFEVSGAVHGFDDTSSSLLLWVLPVNPPSEQPGWYLQRSPTNGIRSIIGNRWMGLGQIGSQRFPPHDGDIVDVAASIVPTSEAVRLEAMPGQLTTVRIPGVLSKIARFRVRLK